METPPPQRGPEPRLIAGIVLFGALVFGGVVAWLVHDNGGGLAEVPIEGLHWIVLGVSLLAVAAGPFVGQAMANRLRASMPAGAPVQQAEVVRVLVSTALLEGAILLNLVAWLLTGLDRPYAVAAAALWLIGVSRLFRGRRFADDDGGGRWQ